MLDHKKLEMMKRRFAYVIAVLVVCLISGSAIAQPQKGERFNKERAGKMQMHKQQAKKHMMLNLTDEQKEQMKEIRMTGVKESKPVRDKLRELNARKKTLMTAENADMKAINNLLDKEGELKTELAKLQAKNVQKIRSLLTEEQRMKFDARVGKGHKRGFSKGHHRGSFQGNEMRKPGRRG
ncbi:periplasmic heavy metal sensor [Puteibacter caeruleilacunae]|nr:periplasmic heavy metal sensor [Puteibacter caeruleilacunae]